MLAKGWIKPSVFLYSSPVLLVGKKTSKQRMCIDFRVLNANRKLDVFTLPYIADLLDKLGKAKLFSSVINCDLAIDYHQVRIAVGNMHKTEILTNKGLYEYVVMLFGLCNPPETSQRLINLIFSDFINEFVAIYLDILLLYSETYQ